MKSKLEMKKKSVEVNVWVAKLLVPFVKKRNEGFTSIFFHQISKNETTFFSTKSGFGFVANNVSREKIPVETRNGSFDMIFSSSECSYVTCCSNVANLNFETHP